MTAAEFYAAYCARSGIGQHDLAALGQRAYLCKCGEEGCEGWAMLAEQSVEFDRRHGFRTRGIAADDPGFAP